MDEIRLLVEFESEVDRLENPYTIVSMEGFRPLISKADSLLNVYDKEIRELSSLRTKLKRAILRCEQRTFGVGKDFSEIISISREIIKTIEYYQDNANLFSSKKDTISEDKEIRIKILNFLKEMDKLDPYYEASESKIVRGINLNEQDVKRNLRYLEEKRLVSIRHYLGGGMIVKINSNGIDFIEENQIKPKSRINNIEETLSEYDFFICHASEDKKDFVDVLVNELRKSGIKVWYDSLNINWGDDLRQTITTGLKKCKYGIVVFSKSFLKKKKWTEFELDNLFAREKDGKRVILPIWHNIEQKDLEDYGAFAHKVAIRSSDLQEIKNNCLKLLEKT